MTTNDNAPAYLTVTDLQPLLEALKGDILTAVDTKNQGLAASLTRQVKSLTGTQTNSGEGAEQDSNGGVQNKPRMSMADQALAAQVQQLQQQVQAEIDLRQAAETKRLEAERNSVISGLVSKAKLDLPETVQTLFLARHGSNLQHEDGNWYAKVGDTTKSLDDVFNEYLTTSEAQRFMPPAAGSSGTNKGGVKPGAVGQTPDNTGSKLVKL